MLLRIRYKVLVLFLVAVTLLYLKSNTYHLNQWFNKRTTIRSKNNQHSNDISSSSQSDDGTSALQSQNINTLDSQVSNMQQQYDKDTKEDSGKNGDHGVTHSNNINTGDIDPEDVVEFLRQENKSNNQTGPNNIRNSNSNNAANIINNNNINAENIINSNKNNTDNIISNNNKAANIINSNNNNADDQDDIIKKFNDIEDADLAEITSENTPVPMTPGLLEKNGNGNITATNKVNSINVEDEEDEEDQEISRAIATNFSIALHDDGDADDVFFMSGDGDNNHGGEFNLPVDPSSSDNSESSRTEESLSKEYSLNQNSESELSEIVKTKETINTTSAASAENDDSIVDDAGNDSDEAESENELLEDSKVVTTKIPIFPEYTSTVSSKPRTLVTKAVALLNTATFIHKLEENTSHSTIQGQINELKKMEKISLQENKTPTFSTTSDIVKKIADNSSKLRDTSSKVFEEYKNTAKLSKTSKEIRKDEPVTPVGTRVDLSSSSSSDNEIRAVEITPTNKNSEEPIEDTTDLKISQNTDNNTLEHNYKDHQPSDESECITTFQPFKSGRNKYNRPHHCLFFSEYFDTCTKSKKYYPDHKNRIPLKCKSKQFAPLCQYKENLNPKNIWSVKLKCDLTPCRKNTLKLTTLNETNGFMNKKFVDNLYTLKLLIEEERRKISKSKLAPFVFISCTHEVEKDKEKIRQILVLPPTTRPGQEKYQQQSYQKKKLNINIIAIDSLSRQHFFRILPRTVQKMRQINEQNLMEILDFKGVQSLAPFTYVNVNALMNGTIDGKTYKPPNERMYAIGTLFRQFKQAGYQTLLHEEACWHNQWGSLLNGNNKIKKSANPFKLWLHLTNFTTQNSFVDSYGLTHMTCEALRKYRMTSLFDSVKILCLNGKPLTSYFIDYVKRELDYRDKRLVSGPLLSYTHINFAHEKTGSRIRALDEAFSELISFLSKREDTVTIFWSDHGNKQSKYSMDTLTGRYEVYDSLLFMLLPNKLKAKLSTQIYNALLSNQESLINILDIRDTILLLKDFDLSNTRPEKLDHNGLSTSLFSSALQDRRSCKSMSIRKYALCKCISNTSFVNPEDDEYKQFLLWLAEHSVGYLNNKLTNYQSPRWSREQQQCIRLQASKIRLVIEEQTDVGSIYTFDLVTKKSDGTGTEVFNIRLFYNSHRKPSLDIMRNEFWNRVSTYQNFAHCRDNNVPISLCVCNKRSSAKFQTPSSIASYTQFGTSSDLTTHKSQTTNQTSCLHLLKRNHGNKVIAFEVWNACEADIIEASFNVSMLTSWQVDQPLPIVVKVEPSQIVFLATFLKAFDMDEPLMPELTVKNQYVQRT